MAATDDRRGTRQFTAAAGALVAVQLLHGAIPGPDNESASLLGTVVGAALLTASIIGVWAAVTNRHWARVVIGYIGAAVAGGFVLYHAIPVKTPLSYPYWGVAHSARLSQWLPVLAAIAVGTWCCALALPRRDARHRSTQTHGKR